MPIKVNPSSADRLSFYLVDVYKDPTQDNIEVETPIDLSTVTNLHLEWELENKAQPNLTIEKDADQVTNPGLCYLDLEATTVTDTGNIEATVVYNDSLSNPHRSDKFHMQAKA